MLRPSPILHQRAACNTTLITWQATPPVLRRSVNSNPGPHPLFRQLPSSSSCYSMVLHARTTWGQCCDPTAARLAALPVTLVQESECDAICQEELARDTVLLPSACASLLLPHSGLPHSGKMNTPAPGPAPPPLLISVQEAFRAESCAWLQCNKCDGSPRMQTRVPAKCAQRLWQRHQAPLLLKHLHLLIAYLSH